MSNADGENKTQAELADKVKELAKSIAELEVTAVENLETNNPDSVKRSAGGNGKAAFKEEKIMTNCGQDHQRFMENY